MKEKHFWMGVLHGGSNREEITGFAVKRLNVPLLATVTVMPHTTTSVSLYLHTHTTRWGCHMLDMKEIMVMMMPHSRWGKRTKIKFQRPKPAVSLVSSYHRKDIHLSAQDQKVTRILNHKKSFESAVFFMPVISWFSSRYKEYETQKDHLQNKERIYINEEIREATPKEW